MDGRWSARVDGKQCPAHGDLVKIQPCGKIPELGADVDEALIEGGVCNVVDNDAVVQEIRD